MSFINDDFMLDSDKAIDLFVNTAKDLPILDFHCHLDPADIAKDKRYATITEAWLGGDHYRWRVMRACGVNERFVTGDASPWEKFQKWAEVVPRLIRNPIFHWVHLELKRFFGIDTILSPSTAREIYDECNRQLKTLTARQMMLRSNVKLVCTTDDPTSRLEHHQAIREDDSFDVQVLPTWRPDKALAVANPDTFNDWVNQLSMVSGVFIEHDFANFLRALHLRMDAFVKMGCKLADHGIPTFYVEPCEMGKAEAVFLALRSGGAGITPQDILQYKSYMLNFLCMLNYQHNLAQMFHYGPIRNQRTILRENVGVDAGGDSIGDMPVAEAMGRFLDLLDRDGLLTRTIISNINPADNAVVATMCGNFQDGSVFGKMQMATAWWHMDQEHGMREMMNTLSMMGVLSTFVGMVTDSRSFLSYPRHEYFRRILCNILGSDLATMRIPGEMEEGVNQMIRDICWNNAVRYFGFNLETI